MLNEALKRCKIKMISANVKANVKQTRNKRTGSCIF